MASAAPPPPAAKSRAEEHRHWQQILEDWSERLRTCYRCGDLYYEAENVGRWRCFQHAARLDPGTVSSGTGTQTQRVWAGVVDEESPQVVQTWRCCGAPLHGKASQDRNGCIPCDHNDRPAPWSRLEDTPLPKGLVADAISPDPESILGPGDSLLHLKVVGQQDRKRYTVVRRYDWRRAEAIIYGRAMPEK